MMISRLAVAALTASFVVGSAAAFAGNPSGGPAAASTIGTGAGSTSRNGSSGVVGSAGSAAAGDTSASSLGVGATSTVPTGSSSSIGVGGSAAAPNGRTMSNSHVNRGGNNLNGQSMNQAHDPGGVWSKSHTQTKVRGDELSSRTKSMAHQPGGPPVKSTSRTNMSFGE